MDGSMDGCRNISYWFCFSGESLVVNFLFPLLFPTWYPGGTQVCVLRAVCDDIGKRQVFREWGPIPFSCQILSQLQGLLKLSQNQSSFLPKLDSPKFHGPQTQICTKVSIQSAGLMAHPSPCSRVIGPFLGKLPKQAHWSSIHCPSHVEARRSGNKLQASLGLTVPTFVMLQMYPGWVRAI